MKIISSFRSTVSWVLLTARPRRVTPPQSPGNSVTLAPRPGCRPNDTTRTEYTGVFYSGAINDNLSVYGEFASENNNDARFMKDSNERWAGYISLNYSGLGYGVSVEYKNYNRFILGTGRKTSSTRQGLSQYIAKYMPGDISKAVLE